MNTQGLKPSRALYGIAAGILFIGIVVFIVLIVSGLISIFGNIGEQVVVPGTHTIELKDEGSYVIYFEYKSVVDGKVYETDNISGLNCTLKSVETGEMIKLNTSTINTNYSIGSREGKSVFDFDIAKAGKYELKSWYEDNDGMKAVLTIGKGFGAAIFQTLFVSLGVLGASFVLSALVFVFTYMKRKKARVLLLDGNSC